MTELYTVLYESGNDIKVEACVVKNNQCANAVTATVLISGKRQEKPKCFITNKQWNTLASRAKARYDSRAT